MPEASEINLMPFSDIRVDGYFDYQNILLFIPPDFFLPSIWKSMRTPGKTVFLGFALSFCVESCQLLNFRASDVTDLIYNTIGTLLGFIAWAICRMLFSHRCRKTIQLSRMEPELIILIPVLSVFLFFNPRISLGDTSDLADSQEIISEIGTLPRADDDSFSTERDWVLSHADLFPDGKAKKAKDNPELIHFM